MERHVTGSTMLYKPDRTRTGADSRQKQTYQPPQQVYFQTHINSRFQGELGFLELT